MCGIAGMIWKDPQRPGDQAAVQRMGDLIAHRGPDSAGTVVLGPTALGHRRLSIIDLSDAGRQPMASVDGRYVIVFNGEIYNYRELRKELAGHGARFHSHTDTEVILEAYRVWGEACVTRFVGMWAFALFDVPEQRLFLSRDRFGIKPLYYCEDADGLWFASEIKAILGVRPELRRPHYPYLGRLLMSGQLDDGPETCFEKILSLPPAHSARWEARAPGLAMRRYWDVAPGALAARARQAPPVAALRELLEDAVALHMRSDVPVGTCLSGGLDSSALVGLINHLTGHSVHTFSGMYADKSCDERRYVQAVNGFAKTIPCPIYPEPNGNLVDDLATITWHQDEPTAGPGLYTQFQVMKRAAASVKVILDGQGADELFGGYLWYYRLHLQDLQKKGWGGKWAAWRLLAEMRRHWGQDGIRSHLDLFVPGWVQAWQRSRPAAPPSAAAELLTPALQEACKQQPLARAPVKKYDSYLAQVMYEQITTTSLPALLHYEDRNSMAFSIEARVPYLDHRVAEFALGLESHWKIRGGWTKYVLRQAVDDVLPRSVAARRGKLGYATPMDRWLRQPSEREALRAVLFSSRLGQRDIIRPETVERLWREHQEGQNHSWMLYRVLTMEMWFRHLVDQFVPLPAVKPGGASLLKAAA